MKKNTTIQKGDWSSWPAEIKAEFDADNAKTVVGEILVHENEDYKVWHIYLKPGTRLPFHKHIHPYFWSILSSGTSRSYYEDGSVVETEYEPGDTLEFKDLSEKNSFTHNLENIGDTTLVFATVEFLTAQN